MKTFDVFYHPTHGHEAVKRGFSWPAFFFTWIWALLKKCWGQAALIVGAMVVLILLQAGFEAGHNDLGMLVLSVLQIGLSVAIGTVGNEWRKSNLLKRGYESSHTIEAETADAAVATVARNATA